MKQHIWYVLFLNSVLYTDVTLVDVISLIGKSTEIPQGETSSPLITALDETLTEPTKPSLPRQIHKLLSEPSDMWLLHRNAIEATIKNALREALQECLQSGKQAPETVRQQLNEDLFKAILLEPDTTAVSTIDALLKRGADVNARDPLNPVANQTGDTPLISALVYGKQKSAQVLIDRGADVNAVNESGWTALMVAAHLGYVNLVEKLLQHGANKNMTTFSDQVTAEQLARQAGYTVTADIIKNWVSKKA